jgi:transposase
MAKSPDGAAVSPGMDVPAVVKIALTSVDRMRAVIHNFNEDGLDARTPKYVGRWPPMFTLPERREIKEVALSRPQDHNLPFLTWTLSRPTESRSSRGTGGRQ